MSMVVSLGSPTCIGNEGGEQEDKEKMGKDKREPEEGNQGWKMTFTKEIISGPFLGNVEASYKRNSMAASLGSPTNIGKEHSEGGKQDDRENGRGGKESRGGGMDQ